MGQPVRLRDIMIQIGDYIFSMDILEKKFVCDLESCHGNCCVEGYSGAFLSKEESVILSDIFPVVKEYLGEEGIKAIEEQGTSMVDSDGDIVTPLVGDQGECAYAVLEGKTWLCAIEKAWLQGKIDFRKPVSCQLFPIRVKKFSNITAVNYRVADTCESARKRGAKEGIPVYVFLKEAIIRAFGKDVYKELSIVGKDLESGKIKRNS